MSPEKQYRICDASNGAGAGGLGLRVPSAEYDVTVVVPTYREAQNVPVLFERLKAALDGLPWEMIVVDDDSPDGTAEVALLTFDVQVSATVAPLWYGEGTASVSAAQSGPPSVAGTRGPPALTR